MSSELQASWSGPLKSKKKNELQHICRQLAIEYKSESLKADLEQQIRQRFKDSPNLQDDERFKKLDHSGMGASPKSSVPVSSRRSNRGRSVSRPPQELDDDAQGSVEDTNRSKLPTSRKSSFGAVSSNPEQISNPELPAPQKILVTLVNPEKDLNQSSRSKSHPNVAEHPTKVTRLAKQASQQTLVLFNAFVRRAARCTIATIQAIQTILSSPWKLCAIAILIELTFVIYSMLPLRRRILVNSNLDGISVRIPEPVLRLFNLIMSKYFLRPFSEYLSFTVVVPMVFAGLMNVPNYHQSGKNDQRQFEAKRDLKPSVFLWCVTRLAVLALVHVVFYPNRRFGWPHEEIYLRPSVESSSLHAETHHISPSVTRNIELIGLESIQYIITTFAMVFSFHRLIWPSSESSQT